MTNRTRLVLAAAASFTLGAMISVIGAYMFARPLLRVLTVSPFLDAASNGVLMVKVLQGFRSGHTDDSIAILESLVDGDLETICLYEKATPTGNRDPAIENDAIGIREYQQRFHASTHVPDCK
jgi:hypothetical protein